jgi:hypothetical protein
MIETPTRRRPGRLRVQHRQQRSRMFPNDFLECSEIAGTERRNQLRIVVLVRVVPRRGSRSLHGLRLPQRPPITASHSNPLE